MANGLEADQSTVRTPPWRAASSPLFAGVMALADQAAGFHHGFANPAFYALAGSSAFRDVVQPASPLAVARVDFANTVDPTNGFVYSLRTLDFGCLSIHTVAGYDDVTGLGTPNGAIDRKSTRLNSSHSRASRMPSSA